MYPCVIGASGGDTFGGGGVASEHRRPLLKRSSCLVHAPHTQTPSTTHSLYRKAFFLFLLSNMEILWGASTFFLTGFYECVSFFFSPLELIYIYPLPTPLAPRGPEGGWVLR